MTYVYDLLLDINAVSFERYGVTYKLEQTFKMGNRKMSSFKADGMDKVLVVPQFIEQYCKLDSKLKNLTKKKTFEDCVKYIQQRIDPEPVLDAEPDPEDENVMIQNIVCQFKDIRVKIYYKKETMELDSEFEIVQNNLFGNGILVETKHEDEE